MVNSPSLGNTLAKLRIVHTRSMEHIDAHKNSRQGERLGQGNPPKPNSCLLKDLTRNSLKKDVTALLVTGLIMAVGVEIYKLTQVPTFSKHLLHHGVGRVQSRAWLGKVKNK